MDGGDHVRLVIGGDLSNAHHNPACSVARVFETRIREAYFRSVLCAYSTFRDNIWV